MVFVIMYGCVAEGDSTDEVIGYLGTERAASLYCHMKNMTCDDDHAFYFEPARNLALD